MSSPDARRAQLSVSRRCRSQVLARQLLGGSTSSHPEAKHGGAGGGEGGSYGVTSGREHMTHLSVNDQNERRVDALALRTARSHATQRSAKRHGGGGGKVGAGSMSNFHAL